MKNENPYYTKERLADIPKGEVIGVSDTPVTDEERKEARKLIEKLAKERREKRKELGLE